MNLRACAMSLFLLPAVAAADPFAKCALDACLFVKAGADTDGDGVTDLDEIAAGTDPNDPASTPRMPKLLDLIRLDKLPSFRTNDSIVIVLPTRAPNGKSVLGGIPALPGRKNTLAALGVTSSMVGTLDLANGLAIGRTDSAGSGKPPVRVGGIDMTLISAGGGASGPAPTGAITHAVASSCWYCWDPANITAANSTTIGMTTFGSIHIQAQDGIVGPTDETTDVTWSRGPGGYTVTATTQESGKTVRVTSQTEKKTTNPDGTTTSTNTHVVDDPKKGTKDTTTKETHSSGSTVLTKTNETTVAGTKRTRTTTTTTAANGQVTSTKTCVDNGCDVINECDAACQGGTVTTYVNPDDTTYDASADRRRMGLAPTDLISTIVRVHGGNVTQGDTPVEVDGEPPVTSTPNGPLVIHVEEDPSGNLGVGLGIGLPKPVPQPRIDPNLPVVPLGTLPSGCNKPGTC